MNDVPRDRVTRRDLLKTTSCGAAAVGLGAITPAMMAETPASRPSAAFKKPPLPYGKLGRTGLPVTLISFGAIRISEKLGTRICKALIDSGVNLVHTSASYVGGKSIAAVADLFKANKEYRDKVFLCLKSFKPESEKEIDDMLKTLGTDHTDALLTTLEEAEPRRLETMQKQQETLIKKGKLRHTGFVCHGDMHGVMEMVIEKAPKFFEVALLAMRMLPLGTDEGKLSEDNRRFVRNLKAFRENGVGILSMKSGAKDAVTRGTEVFLPHAKAVLEAGADSLLTSVNSFEQVDMIKTLDLRSRNMTAVERKAADDFFLNRSQACLMCASCRKTCPKALPVNDLMRVRMYHDEYGWPDHARDEFDRLGIGAAQLASACGDCTTCTQVCPVGLASASTVRQVARLFA